MTPKEFAKKIIASINPGTADISDIGDGTIKGAISEQNKNLTASDNLKFRFATDGEGNYGYLKADDSFVPFKREMKVPPTMKRSSSITINCDIGDTIYVVSAYVVTQKTGVTQVTTTNMTLNNGSVVAAYYEYKATQNSVTLAFSGAGSLLYFIP